MLHFDHFCSVIYCTVDEKIHLQLLYITQASQVTIVLSGDKFMKHRQVCIKMHHCAWTCVHYWWIKGPAAKNATRESPGSFNQILNFESWKWSPVATFESWNNKSGLSFFDFQLFHVQKQVLSQIVIFLGHFFPLHFPIHLPVHCSLLCSTLWYVYFMRFWI